MSSQIPFFHPDPSHRDILIDHADDFLLFFSLAAQVIKVLKAVPGSN
jgi:hypothetical protein